VYRFRRLIVVLAGLLLAGGAALAALRTGAFDRLDKTYAEWSLRQRVMRLADARIEGNLKEVYPLIMRSCQPRARVGNAIPYVSFAIKDVKIDRNVASVTLGAMYRLPMVGLKAPQPIDLEQRWVRVGRTWYWDPGPPPEGGTVTVEGFRGGSSRANSTQGR
jgi:hypothetical protein